MSLRVVFKGEKSSIWKEKSNIIALLRRLRRDEASYGRQNVIGVRLGNGMQNNPYGGVWGFEKAAFRSAPFGWKIVVKQCVFFCEKYKNGGGRYTFIAKKTKK